MRSVLSTKKVARLLGLSIPTVRRRLKDAREGRDPLFPLPIGESRSRDGPRRKLTWSLESLVLYMTGTSQGTNTPLPESPTQRRRRNAIAMAHIQANHSRKPKKEKEGQ